MRMFMQCIKTKRFVKVNIEEIQAGNKEAPIWVMVDNEEDATNDPGWIGDDHSMAMIMYVTEHYGCTEGLTCFTPTADVEKAEQEKKEQEERRAKMAEEYDGNMTISILGCGNSGTRGMARRVASTLSQAILYSAPAHETYPDIDIASLEPPCLNMRHMRSPKQKGYQPTRKQMRALNRQTNQRSKRMGR